MRTAFVFGSFARGEPFRDLDVAVELGEAFGMAALGRVGHALWLAAGRPAFEIDVVPLDDATPAFVLRVADEGALLVEAVPGGATELAARAQSELIDFEEGRRIVATEDGGR